MGNAGSEKIEVELAKSKSRQIPLGAVDAQRLPAQVRQMQPWVEKSAAFLELEDAPRACLDWLKSEYAH